MAKNFGNRNKRKSIATMMKPRPNVRAVQKRKKAEAIAKRNANRRKYFQLRESMLKGRRSQQPD
jgi:hypothetical protein